MDSQVKERIIGAVVLVALGVWLIPWILDGSDPGEAAPDALPELLLPSTDEILPLRTENVDLTRRPPAPVEAEPANAALASESTPPLNQAPAVESPPEIAPAVSASRAATAADSPPAAPPASPEPVRSSPAAAVSTPPATARPAANAPPAGAWAVQVGAFGERANAVQLASRVSDYGFAAQVSEYRSNGRTMHRVRVGGFATREQADAARSSLAAHGVPGTVMPSD